MDPSPESDLAARVRAASLIGRVISSRYRIVELVAMGGMGAVYRGEHLRMRKRVAIKVLHPQMEGLPELVARFEREAVAGAHIQHPNVAAATDFGELEDGSYFLALEYVAGRTLHDVIKKEAPFPPARAAHVARQLASALAASHAAGVVHRDVKPRNVMLVEGTDDHAKLIDFGLATVAADRISTKAADTQGERAMGRLTGEGVIVGTVAYLAPEAALGMGAVDARSDLYALGVILYEMLAGKHPFDATEASALFKQQRFDAPKPIAERAGVRVPAEIEAIALRLMAKDPTARFTSGTEVVTALDRAGFSPRPVASPLADEPLSPSPPPSVASPRTASRASVAKRPSRVPQIVAALAAVAALVFFLLPESQPPPVTAPSQEPAHAPAAAPSVTALPAAPAPTVVTPAALPAPRATADATTSKAQLLKSAQAEDWKGAEPALLALIDADPSAFRERQVRVAARDVATALERDRAGDAVFDALASRIGTDGLDVLYDVSVAKGGSLAAKRAAAFLRTPEALARATPALRISIELREAACDEKLALLDRAVAEGDHRTLLVLENQAGACFKKNRAMEAAIKSLRSRLSKK